MIVDKISLKAYPVKLIKSSSIAAPHLEFCIKIAVQPDVERKFSSGDIAALTLRYTTIYTINQLNHDRTIPLTFGGFFVEISSSPPAWQRSSSITSGFVNCSAGRTTNTTPGWPAESSRWRTSGFSLRTPHQSHSPRSSTIIDMAGPWNECPGTRPSISFKKAIEASEKWFLLIQWGFWAPFRYFIATFPGRLVERDKILLNSKCDLFCLN